MKKYIAMDVFEMTDNGLQKIVRIDAEPSSDKEAIKESISQVAETIFSNDSLYMTFDDQAFIIKGLKTKTIVLKAVWEESGGK